SLSARPPCRAPVDFVLAPYRRVVPRWFLSWLRIDGEQYRDDLLVEHVRFARTDALFDLFDVEVELAELEFFGERFEFVGLL
ncbi:MAG: hypothetical protein ACI87A_002149, partial [Planctomycetota bacterium]